MEANDPTIRIQNHDQAPGGVDDGGGEISLFGEGFLYADPVGDIGQGTFIIGNLAARSAHRTRILENRNLPSGLGAQLQLEVSQLSIPLELIQPSGSLSGV